MLNFEDRNVTKKEVGMILRFLYHTTEMQCAWNVRTEETPVTIGPNATI
jgi:hypothetical protein